MKIKYFADTDTAYIELSHSTVAETKDINENILIDLDEKGNVVGITIERARLGRYSGSIVPANLRKSRLRFHFTENTISPFLVVTFSDCPSCSSPATSIRETGVSSSR